MQDVRVREDTVLTASRAERYRGVADRHLADTLVAEDAAEQRGVLSAHDRTACRLHRRWLYQCISSPAHVIPMTGHRWCLRCEAAVTVAVDELTGSVDLRCTRCGSRPRDLANLQVVDACAASFAASRRKLHLVAARGREGLRHPSVEA